MNFVICPTPILLGYPSLSKDAKFFYLHLLRYAMFSIMNGHVDEEGNPQVFARKETLANDLGVSRYTISRYLSELKKHNLCSIVRRGHGRTDLIIVYPPKSSLEEKVREETPEETVIIQKDSELTDLVSKVMVDTLQKVQEKSEKRKKRNKQPKQNSHTLIKWFENEVAVQLQTYPPLNGKKELALVKKMIEHYGYDVTKEIFEWAIKHWVEFKKIKKLDGNLNVSIVYGFRDFIVEQMTSKKQVTNEEIESVW